MIVELIGGPRDGHKERMNEKALLIFRPTEVYILIRGLDENTICRYKVIPEKRQAFFLGSRIVENSNDCDQE